MPLKDERDPLFYSLVGELGHLSALFEGLLEVTSHVESTFGILITLALEKSAEAFDGFLELDELAWLA
jgi:hypothetical protein